jgi:hypothetical protein
LGAEVLASTVETDVIKRDPIKSTGKMNFFIDKIELMITYKQRDFLFESLVFLWKKAIKST